MVIVEDNKITMTKGDTLILTLNLVKNKKIFVPEPGDRIFFTMSRHYEDELNYRQVIRKEILVPEINEGNKKPSIVLILEPEDTLYETDENGNKDYSAPVHNGLYEYDIKVFYGKPLVYGNMEIEHVDTFISNTIQLLGKCDKNNIGEI